MSKNKTLDKKIIFKILKIFQVSQQTFVLQTLENGFKKQFLKTIFKNCFKKLLPSKL